MLYFPDNAAIFLDGALFHEVAVPRLYSSQRKAEYAVALDLADSANNFRFSPLPITSNPQLGAAMKLPLASSKFQFVVETDLKSNIGVKLSLRLLG